MSVGQDILDVLIDIKEDGIDAIKDVREALGDLQHTLDLLALQSIITSTALLQTSAAAATTSTTVSATNSGFGAGIPIIGAWVQAISSTTLGLIAMGPAGFIVLAFLVELVALLATVVLALTGVVVLLGAAALGFAGLAAAIALTVGGLGILAAGMVALADFTFTKGQQEIKDQIAALGIQRDAMIAAGNWSTAQQKEYTASVDALKVKLSEVHDPLKDLEDRFAAVGLVLGEHATPAVDAMTKELQKAAPWVQEVGLRIEDWFGKRLPVVMPIAETAIDPVTKAFDALGHSADVFIQAMIARSPQIGPILQEALNTGVKAVDELLRGLVNFVDWFITNWPKIRPVVEQIMTAAGRAISHLEQIADQVVQWFIENWPEIAHTMQDLQPVLDLLGTVVWILANSFVGAMKVVEGSIWVLGHLRDAAKDAADWIWNAATALGTLQNLAGRSWNIGNEALGSPPGTPSTLGAAGSPIGSHASGGIIPGPIGSPQLIIAHGGEEFNNPYAGAGGRKSWSSTGPTIVVQGSQPWVPFDEEAMMEAWRRYELLHG